MSRFTLLYLHNETGTELLPPVMTTVLSYLEDTYLHVISWWSSSSSFCSPSQTNYTVDLASV